MGVKSQEQRMKTGIIYCATNLINGKCYVGQTTQRLKNRIKRHYKNSEDLTLNYKFVNALRKYKRKDWRWEILVENVSVDQLDLFERSYIWGLSTFEFGYNSTTGGGHCVFSEEIKKKMSKSQTGKRLSQETKNKISKAGKGKIISKQQRKKMSQAAMGKPVSEETRKKISQANIGEKNPHFGKPRPQEVKDKISNAKAKPYKIIKPNGTTEIVKNLKKFCEEYGLSDIRMHAIARGQQKYHKGYRVEKITKS